RFTSQIGHHAHHKWQLHGALSAVNLHVVLNLHAGGAITRDKFLSTTHYALLKLVTLASRCRTDQLRKGSGFVKSQGNSSEWFAAPVSIKSVRGDWARGSRNSCTLSQASTWHLPDC